MAEDEEMIDMDDRAEDGFFDAGRLDDFSLSGVKLEEASNANHMSLEDDAEDPVVRELDVFLTPSLQAGTQLYVLQYPLRPTWRPYGLEERCMEIRVKPGQTRVEVDLAMDTSSENYDNDADDHIKLQKQTLTSSRISLNTSYAIGVLRGNELHLNPLHALVQMRPSLKYLDQAESSQKKSAAMVDDVEEPDEEAEGDAKPELVALQVQIRRRETERQEETRLQSHAYLTAQDEAEPWMVLDAQGTASEGSQRTFEALHASTSSPLPFSLPLERYVDALAPGRTAAGAADSLVEDGTGNAGLSRSYLQSLPLDQRYLTLFTKGQAQVLQFERLMKLAPQDATEDDVVDIIQDYAVLVQGCWVTASHVRYAETEETVRDYLLLLFTKNRVIYREQLEELSIPKEMLRELLLPFAQQKGGQVGWEFLESTDRVFMKKFPAAVKQQAEMWSKSEPRIRSQLEKLQTSAAARADGGIIILDRQPPRPAAGAPAKASMAASKVVGRAATGASLDANEGRVSMSDETRAALPQAVRYILERHSVCNLQFLCQCLREEPIRLTQLPKPNAKAINAAVAASKAAAAPAAELAAVMSKIAGHIDGSYFLPSLNNIQLDPFRNVVIGLLRQKGPNVGLRKNEVLEAAKQVLRVDVPSNIYQRVLKELCYTRGGVWVMKPGDGRPT